MKNHTKGQKVLAAVIAYALAIAATAAIISLVAMGLVLVWRAVL